jgi:hypothetical protein
LRRYIGVADENMDQKISFAEFVNLFETSKAKKEKLAAQMNESAKLKREDMAKKLEAAGMNSPEEFAVDMKAGAYTCSR